jgi:hypothetical protein
VGHQKYGVQMNVFTGFRLKLKYLPRFAACLLILSSCATDSRNQGIDIIASSTSEQTETGISFLTGFELSQKIKTNVVLLWVEELDVSGTGFVVGHSETNLFIATARHVVERSVNEYLHTDIPEIEVTFCGVAGAERLSRAEIVWSAKENDLALLKVQRPEGFEPFAEVLAPGDTVVPKKKVWFVGRDNKCLVPPNEGRIIETTGFDGRMIIDAPIASPGSSGAPSVTGFGIIGMLQEDYGLRSGNENFVTDDSNSNEFQRLKILDIERIRELVVASGKIPWSLKYARNLPPDSWQAARQNITTTLNEYLFNLQNVHANFSRGWAKPDELRRIIPAYNTAYRKYDRERTVFQAAVATHWGGQVEEQFVQIQGEIRVIHMSLFSLNDYREEMYDAGPNLPDEVVEVIKSIDPKVQALVAEYDKFQSQLIAID